MLVIVRNELRTLRMGDHRFSLKVRKNQEGRWKRAGGKAHITDEGLQYFSGYAIKKVSKNRDAILRVPDEHWNWLEKLIRDPDWDSNYFEHSPYREVLEELVDGDNSPRVMRRRDVDALVFSYTHVRFKRTSHLGQEALAVTRCFEGLFPCQAALHYVNTVLFEDSVRNGQLRVSDFVGQPVSVQDLRQRLEVACLRRYPTKSLMIESLNSG